MLSEIGKPSDHLAEQLGVRPRSHSSSKYPSSRIKAHIFGVANDRRRKDRAFLARHDKSVTWEKEPYRPLRRRLRDLGDLQTKTAARDRCARYGSCLASRGSSHSFSSLISATAIKSISGTLLATCMNRSDRTAIAKPNRLRSFVIS
jgi:hypothetical protein